jgi:trehalose 6-phosphate synthase/phosphatase
VIVGPGLSALGEGAYKKASTATPAVVADGAVREPSPSYFSDVPGKGPITKDAYVNSSTSPAQAASGASSGPELLRRLSLVGGAHLTPTTPVSNPMADHPGLQLTGRIISATFCIPYRVVHHPGADWVSPFTSICW